MPHAPCPIPHALTPPPLSCYSAEELDTFQELEKVLLQLMHLAIHAGSPSAAIAASSSTSSGTKAISSIGLINTRLADAYERLVSANPNCWSRGLLRCAVWDARVVYLYWYVYRNVDR